METWEIVLLTLASLVAIRSLATLMRKRRDQILESVQKQVNEYREKQKAAERRARQKKQQEDAA
ncbi:hypothetical protein [Botrimarina hoheduenensis]|uniref:Uncharacterized protein n=1 Tax=Botrimarina hoheduenensis TaxID=2528000 RepID=A0A5C5W8G7_9BACT|nr:hypothetical protein [Botrimarina hoheduenensis]TWT46475.1 hypothetical protein Pla111_15710 [Botrimarina hoheduenensis]